MITITAAVTITCATQLEFEQAREHVSQQNLVDVPKFDEAKRTVTFNIVQIVEAL